MQKALPFIDDLHITLKSYTIRFRLAVLLVVLLVAAAVGAAYYLAQQSGQRVLQDASRTLAYKESGLAQRLKAWCTDVESFATNIAKTSVVQLSVSYYDSLSPEDRKNLGSGAGQIDEDKELVNYLKDMFATYADSHNIAESAIVMADGDILLASGGTGELSSAWKALRVKTMQEKSFQYGRLHARENQAYIDVAVPIFPPVEGESGKPLAALLMALPLDSRFAYMLTPPADARGIQKIAFVQLTAQESGHRRLSVEKQGNQLFVRTQFENGGADPMVRTLGDSQTLIDDQQTFYTMYFPSGEKLPGYICLLVPQEYIDQTVEKMQYGILAALGVAVAFLCLILVLASLLRDRFVRALVNRRISEQKAMLDSINASIQDGMILLSKDGNVMYMNEHFFSADGQARWVHMRLEDALSKEAADKVLGCMAEVLQSDKEGSVELLYGEENAKRLYRVTVYPGHESKDLSRNISLGCVAFFRDITEFRNKARESQLRIQKILNVFSTVIEGVDAGLRGHTEKVLAILDTLAPLLRFSREEQDTLNIAARLFQVGKLFVPRHLLHKKGKLTPEEYAQVSKAPEAAYELICSLNFGLPVAETVYEMNERVDGRGPRGLKGEEILFTARVLSAVNAFCSMVSPRSYRRALTVEEAQEQLREDTGFDREVVDALCTISVKDFQTILLRCTGEGETFNSARALWESVDNSPADTGQGQEGEQKQ